MRSPVGDHRTDAAPIRSLVMTRSCLVATSTKSISESQRSSLRFARRTTIEIVFPSGEICGSVIRTILVRSSAENRRLCEKPVAAKKKNREKRATALRTARLLEYSMGVIPTVLHLRDAQLVPPARDLGKDGAALQTAPEEIRRCPENGSTCRPTPGSDPFAEGE